MATIKNRRDNEYEEETLISYIFFQSLFDGNAYNKIPRQTIRLGYCIKVSHACSQFGHGIFPSSIKIKLPMERIAKNGIENHNG